jgi:hypothetical protein
MILFTSSNHTYLQKSQSPHQQQCLETYLSLFCCSASSSCSQDLALAQGNAGKTAQPGHKRQKKSFELPTKKSENPPTLETTPQNTPPNPPQKLQGSPQKRDSKSTKSFKPPKNQKLLKPQPKAPNLP